MIANIIMADIKILLYIHSGFLREAKFIQQVLKRKGDYLSMSENSRGKQTSRVIYFDHLRILATVAVMMLHVAAANWYTTDVNGIDWAVFNFYDSIVRWGVPVFVMISGALFLNRDDIPVKKIYSKYVLRMLTAYCTWSFIYYLFAGDTIFQQLAGLIRPGKMDKYLDIINSHYHLWFIPMIVGLYICLPIIKQIVKNEKVAVYFLGISFIAWFLIPQIVTLIQDFGGEKLIIVTNAAYETFTDLKLNLVMNYTFYFILGYELSKIRFSKKIRIIIYILGIIGFGFTILANWIVTIKTQTPTGTYYGNACVNILFESIAVFELYKNIPFKNGKASKITKMLSKWSFGAYLVHALIIEQFMKYGFSTLSFFSGIATPLIVVAVFILSYAISAMIHYIPILNKYIV